MLNVERGEGRLLLLLIVHSFFLGLAQLFMETAADAIFLGQQPVTLLPYVYIAMAIVGVLVGGAIGRAQRLLSFKGFVSMTLAVPVVSIVGLWALLLTRSGWVPIAIAVWNDTVLAVCELQLAALSGRLFTVRQFQRLFPVVGAGYGFATLVGGLAVPSFVALLGTAALLPLAAGCLAAALLIAQRVLALSASSYRAPEEDDGNQLSEHSTRQPSRSWSRDRYVLLIAGIVAFEMLVYFLLQTAFLADSRARFPDQNALASFFGMAFGVAAFVSLVLRGVASARFLRRYGVLGGLAIRPAVLLLSVATAAVGGLVFHAAGLVFWAIVVSRLGSLILNDSFGSPAKQMLYQPLPAAKRLWAQAFAETICAPLLTGVAGVTLIVFMLIRPLSGANLSWLLLGVLALWAILGIRAGRQYSAQLLQALAKRSVRHSDFPQADASTIAVLESALAGAGAGAVIYALNMLEQLGYEQLDEALGKLLTHTETDVRLHCLRCLERLGFTSQLAAVRTLIQAGTERPAVRAVGLRAFAALADADATDVVGPFLEDADPQLRLGAIIALLRHGGVEGVLLAGEPLIRLLDSALWGDRALAAQVLGEVAVPGLNRSLRKLLNDEHVMVREAALEAAGNVGSPALWPDAAALLNLPEVRLAAGRALIKGGASAVPALAQTFEAPGQQREVQVRVAHIAQRIGGEDAVAFLRRHLGFADCRVRNAVLAALAACQFQAKEHELEFIHGRLHQEAENAAWLLGARADIAAEEAMLGRALSAEYLRARDNVLLLLSFVQPSEPMSRVRGTIGSAFPEKQAYALELLDGLLGLELKGVVVPLFEPLPAAEALRRLAAVFPQPRLPLGARLLAILDRPAEWISAWTRAAALESASRLDEPGLESRVQAAAAADDPIVRETAIWKTNWSRQPSGVGRLQQLAEDPFPNVAAMARQALAELEGVTRTAVWQGE